MSYSAIGLKSLTQYGPVDYVSVANVAGGNGSDIGAFEAGYTISGRALTPTGQAIRNATVSLFNTQNVRIMTATTSSAVRQVDSDVTNLDISGLE